MTVSNGSISAKADQGGEAACKSRPIMGSTREIHEFDLQEEGSVNYTFVGGDPDVYQRGREKDSFVKSISMALKQELYHLLAESTNAAGLYKGRS
jgi:hypothetical protein